MSIFGASTSPASSLGAPGLSVRIRAFLALLLATVLVTSLVGWPIDLRGAQADHSDDPSAQQHNPDLSTGQSCATDVVFVLDESASIASTDPAYGGRDHSEDVMDATLAMLGALVDTGSRARIVEFGTEARPVDLGGTYSTGFNLVDTALRDAVDDDYFTFSGSTTDADSYFPGGTPAQYTNWQHALQLAHSAPGGGDLVVFVTDGDPTAYFDQDNNLQTTDIDPDGYEVAFPFAPPQARILQGTQTDGPPTGSHILGVFAGGGNPDESNPSFRRMRDLIEPTTGPTGYFSWIDNLDEGIDIRKLDLIWVSDFEDLEVGMRNAINSLCFELAVTKSTPNVAYSDTRNQSSPAPQVIDYEFTVKNVGALDIYNLGVSDPLVSNLKCFANDDYTGVFDIGGSSVPTDRPDPDTDPGGTLEQGDTIYCRGSLTVTSEQMGDDDITNIVSAFGRNLAQELVGPETATETVDVARIKLTKTAEPTVISEQDLPVDVKYTFEIENTGKVDLEDIQLVDAMLAALEADTFTCPGGDLDDDLDAGETMTCTATLRIDEDNFDEILDKWADEDGALRNDATVTGTPPLNKDGATDLHAPKVSDFDHALISLSGLDLTKEAESGPGPYLVEDVIVYKFTVTNDGDVDLGDVEIVDPLDGLVPLADVDDYDDNECDLVNPQPEEGIAFDIGNLVAGGSETCWAMLVVTHEIWLEHGETLENTAIVTGDDGERILTVSDTEDVDLEEPIAEIELTKEAGVASVSQEGQVITYTFTVENTGNVPLSSVTLTDDSLEGLIPVDGDDECGYDEDLFENEGAISWNLGLMQPDSDPIVCHATYTVTEEDIEDGDLDSIDNNADVVGSPPWSEDPKDDVTDVDDETVQINRTAAIELTKTVNPTQVTPANIGQTLSYTFVVRNGGPINLTSVTVTDPLPGLSAINCPAPGNTNITLAPGESVTCTATLTLSQAHINAGSIPNTATATGQSAAGPRADTDSALVVVVAGPEEPDPDPDIDIIKVANVQTVSEPGEVITYTFLVTNTGPVTLTNVQVIDNLVGAVDCGTFNGVLASQASVSCTAQYTVTQADIDAGSIPNLATATGNPPSGPPVSDTDPELVLVEQVLGPDEELPMTGFDSGQMTLIAAGLLAAGIAFAVIGSRRRREEAWLAATNWLE